MVEVQIRSICDRFPGAGAEKLPSGAWLITIPGFRIGPGWNQNQTTVRFLAPVGYPYAKPDCFWVDQALRLGSGGMPQSSNISAIPETGITGVWFSWHVQTWNPNTDSLLNWVAVISDRLRVAR